MFYLKVSIFALIVAAVQAQTDTDSAAACPALEHFEDCGTACPETCQRGVPGACIDMCVRGCFCNKGYIRDQISGKCVKPRDCPQCPKNQVWSDCGSMCPGTCQSQYREPVACAAVCVAKCVCAKDLLLNEETGECVKPSLCPPPCPKHEHYTDCGSRCPTTCQNRPNNNTICTMDCVSGCVCNKGLIRDRISGACILESQCPARCSDPNAHRNNCGTACPGTCYNMNPPCNKRCATGCYCNDGYVLEKRGGVCIKKENCPAIAID